MKLLQAELHHVETIKKIVSVTISEIYPCCYPKEAVDFFLSLHSIDAIVQDIKNNRTWLLLHDGIPVGTGSLKGQYISRVFVLPQFQGIGCGSVLMDFLEKKAAEQFDKATLSASLPAFGLYLKRGYAVAEARKEKLKGGCVLFYEEMEKELNCGVRPDRQVFCPAVNDQTARALWEVENTIRAIPQGLWQKYYCGMPVWKHVYHMLHSLDIWFISPFDPDYEEPPFHSPGMNDLDTPAQGILSESELLEYFKQIKNKIQVYLDFLTPEQLAEKPQNCQWNHVTLILAQLRHLHTHMGMLMGFVVADAGLWPKVIGLKGEIPAKAVGEYF